jgi:hypothetical protein
MGSNNQSLRKPPHLARKQLPQKGDKQFGRSRITNHKDLLPNIDGRGVVARRYRDIVSQIITDQGGAEQMAEARLQLVRRFAACAVLFEAQEARLANGEPLDIAEYSTLTSTLVRVAQRIGINRIAKDITPSLAEYVASKAAEVEA